jgi:hypothetical protein
VGALKTDIKTDKEGAMGWVISLVSGILLLGEALVVTFALMILTDGVTQPPDAFVYLYLAFTLVLVVVGGVLDGLLAKRLSERKSLPLWGAGLATMAASLVIFPTLQCGISAVLLVAFDVI